MSLLWVGNKVNWRDSKTGSIPVEATIIRVGTENGQTVVDLDNGHWAYEHQISGIAMDRMLAAVDELYAKWEAERPGSVAEFWGVKTRIMEGEQI
jgi:hypothetical protein|tara:strand:+ start:1369 stop:1653 length:285 start_codon:yes stop_codon:yes gene_type:complete